jgi:transcriptional regulator with XRE-family HTH domain
MNINISERILAVAEKHGVNNKKVLAERMGIQPQNINSTVLNNPKFEMLEKVADTLGVTVSELVADAPASHIEPQHKCPYCGHDLNIKVE